jgi:beta-fructofuranosidase
VLRLPDHWVWDSWLVVDGGRYHLFFLRASRALHDPERRHFRAGVGHATSTDLRHWELMPDALVHADAPAWDDRAVWTGSVVRGPDDRWYLFYTGVGRVDGVDAQRVGVAISADLVTWHRFDTEPLLEADPRWYECVGMRPGLSEAWRDPFVFRDPGGDGWHMLITARASVGPAGGRGVIGYARADDLLRWEIQPPLSAPAGFRHLEVAQAQFVDGRAVLVFSCLPAEMLPSRQTDLPHAGTWTVLGGCVAEGWRVADGWPVASATPFAHPSLYSARLVPDPHGGWCLLGFRHTEDGVFHGEILDPIPVDWVHDRLIARGTRT